MRIHCVETGPLQCNCYLVEKSGQAVLIDCGGIGDEILSACKQLDVTVAAILLTHGHVDHIEGVDRVVETYSCPVYLHKEDAPCFESAAHNLSVRVYLKPLTVRALPQLFDDNDILEIAGLSFRVIHTPGHTPGSVCFCCGDVLFTGDTLFQGSVGNEFPPFGNFAQEINSIRTKLFVLDKDYTCYPGHGGITSLLYEKKNNQYCGI